MIHFPPLFFSAIAFSPTLLSAFLFLPPSSSFPSSLSSSSLHASSLLLLLSSFSCSWTLGFLPARVVARNSSTAGVAFYDPSSCLPMVDYWPTCFSCFCLSRVLSFCHAAYLNMMWWTSALDLKLHSQHRLLSIFPMCLSKVPVTAY